MTLYVKEDFLLWAQWWDQQQQLQKTEHKNAIGEIKINVSDKLDVKDPYK